MIEIQISSDLAEGPKSDLTVFPFWQGESGGDSASEEGPFQGALSPLKAGGDFKGKGGETTLVYPEGGGRILALGLGKKGELTLEALRRHIAAAIKRCRGKGWERIAIVVPLGSNLSDEELVRGCAEGTALTAYTFDRYLSDSKKKPFALKSLTLLGAFEAHKGVAEKAVKVSEGVHLTRDLVNGNAGDINPEALAACGQALASEFPSITAKVLNRAQIEEERMGLFLAVAQGSMGEPRFICLEYTGDPSSKERSVVIGKGVTFDTGGLDLKPPASMYDMKGDMGGAATALGFIKAAALTNLNKNLVILIAATENGIDAESYKPGDVFVGRAGISVENGNTDAEGRLTLADALTYAVDQYDPKEVIDLATLTGAVEIALGSLRAGLFSTSDEMARKMETAGESSGDLVWRLPLDEGYKEQLKSDIADIKSVGGRKGGSITAAMFLKEFVGKTPWVHLDIAGTAYQDAAAHYNTTKASGFGVRLLIDYFETV